MSFKHAIAWMPLAPVCGSQAADLPEAWQAARLHDARLLWTIGRLMSSQRITVFITPALHLWFDQLIARRVTRSSAQAQPVLG